MPMLTMAIAIPPRGGARATPTTIAMNPPMKPPIRGAVLCALIIVAKGRPEGPPLSGKSSMTKPLTANRTIVREWVLGLFGLSSNMARVEIEAKVGAFLPMLQSRFPPAAFTPASLEYCAARARYLTYAELADHLSAWWREHRPQPPRLVAPATERQVIHPPAPLTADELEHMRRTAAEAIAALRSSAQPDSDRCVPRPVHLPLHMLDEINPLPNGRKRDHDRATSAVPPVTISPD